MTQGLRGTGFSKAGEKEFVETWVEAETLAEDGVRNFGFFGIITIRMYSFHWNNFDFYPHPLLSLANIWVLLKNKILPHL